MPDELHPGDAATAEPITETPPPAPVTVPDPPAPPDLGDAGKKAIDAERAARKALERRLAELEPLAEEARRTAEARKTAEQRLTEKLAAEQAKASAAELQLAQLRAAMAAAPAGMDLADIEKLASRLRGATPDELAEDATELFSRLAPPATTQPTTPAGNGQRPVEQLRSGALPSGADPSIVDQIRAAEAAGNWAEVVRLGAQRVAEIRSATSI